MIKIHPPLFLYIFLHRLRHRAYATYNVDAQTNTTIYIGLKSIFWLEISIQSQVLRWTSQNIDNLTCVNIMCPGLC